MTALRFASIALPLVLAVGLTAQAQTKTEAKTAETKTQQEAKAAKQVAEKREAAENKKALSDATALSRIDEQIGDLAQRVAQAAVKLATAKHDFGAAEKAAASAKASFDALVVEAKKVSDELAAAVTAAKAAEKTAAAKEATEEQKKAGIEARASATKLAAALKAKKEELVKAQLADKEAKAKLEELTKAVKTLEAKHKDLHDKLTTAQEGRRAQQAWMMNRLRADLPLDELGAFLLPLTKDQLLEEAGRWIELVQSKVSAIGATELWLKRNTKAKPEDRDKRQETLVNLQDERAKLVDRTRAILKELTAKGGDKGKVEEIEMYLAAVSGLRLQASDARGATIAIWSWIKSDEGGVRWAKNLGLFLLTLMAFWVVSIVASATVKRGLRASSFSVLMQHSLSGLLKKIIMLVGLVVALSMLEVNINPLLAALGGAAIVVGLALQGTLANFASGMLIMGYRPFDEGDVVDVSGFTGTVQGLSMLSTTLLTPDNKTVVVPNGSVWNGTIVNLSAQPTRRVDMVFGIGYEDEIPKTEELLQEIVVGHEKVLADPPPMIRLHELADSSVNFVVRPWVKTADYWNVYWDIHRSVKIRFDAEGISIPYPQQDVHMHQAAAVAPPPSGGGNGSSTQAPAAAMHEQEPAEEAAEEAAAS